MERQTPFAGPRDYTDAMRVIAGEYRGRRLLAPPGQNTRPILDRVKVALFDWLGSRLALPGMLPPVDVLDVFCGGGSMGIEALSRGATSCTFVDADRAALGCLNENIKVLGLGGRAVVISGHAESARIPAPRGGAFGLIFLDPPYRLSEDTATDSIMTRIVHRLGPEISVADDGLLLWRYPKQHRLPQQFSSGWRAAETRSWGTTSITLFEHFSGESP
jgi:16S rRNA (guanine966-N2)-methyltransferase